MGMLLVYLSEAPGYLIGDPQIFIGDPKLFNGDPRFSVKTSSFLSETANLYKKPQDFHCKNQVFIGSNKLFIGDPTLFYQTHPFHRIISKIFIVNHQALLSETPIFSSESQAFVTNPQISFESPSFTSKAS